jgi:uncharacterized membrane protein
MADAQSEPLSQLKDASADLLKSLGDRVLDAVNDRVAGLTDKLEGVAEGGPIGKATGEGAKAAAEGGSPVLGALKGAASGVKDKVSERLGGGGGGGDGKATKSTNIIESIDIGVPVTVAYNQWTEFGSFPSFMKKVERVDSDDDTKLEFKAQIFLSHRTWEATILEQVPDERIVWRSKGEKGHVDGAVTFHELGSNLTRILVVLEYYPQGLFEKTGNLWRAQGRRARAELRHFRRHVMTRTILEPSEVEGWRGVIEDGEVVTSHEDFVREEEADDGGDEPEDEYDEEEPEEGDEPEDEYDEEEPEEGDEPEDEYDEEEEPEDEDLEPEDEYEEEPEPEDEDEAEPEDEDEYDEEEEPEDEEDEEDEEEPEEEQTPRSRRRRSA